MPILLGCTQSTDTHTYLGVKVVEVEELELEHDEVILLDTLLHQ